jgi:hypothetical protein
MAKRLDWDAHKFRKRPRPLVTAGEKKDNKLKAVQLAERIRKGHRPPQAHRYGAARQWTPEEIAAWAEGKSYAVADMVKIRPPT